MKNFFKEFKDFISKGNVLDLAVAFIIGAAFKTIISSFVNHIIMPVVSLVVGADGFANYKYVIRYGNESLGLTENAIYYGAFIQNIIDFIIIAFVVFMMVKMINRLKQIKPKKEEAVVVEPPKQPSVEELLTDIKGLLVNIKKS